MVQSAGLQNPEFPDSPVNQKPVSHIDKLGCSSAGTAMIVAAFAVAAILALASVVALCTGAGAPVGIALLGASFLICGSIFTGGFAMLIKDHWTYLTSGS